MSTDALLQRGAGWFGTETGDWVHFRRVGLGGFGQLRYVCWELDHASRREVAKIAVMTSHGGLRARLSKAPGWPQRVQTRAPCGATVRDDSFATRGEGRAVLHLRYVMAVYI